MRNPGPRRTIASMRPTCVIVISAGGSMSAPVDLISLTVFSDIILIAKQAIVLILFYLQK